MNYRRSHKHTPEDLERAYLADLITSARSSFRETRKGGFWEGDAEMIAYAEKCQAEFRAGRAALKARISEAA